MHAEYDPKSESAPKLAFQHKFFVKHVVGFTVSEEEANFQLIRYHVSTGLRLLPTNLADAERESDELTKHVMAEITAEFVSEYRIIKPDLSKEAIEEFGKYNTMLHIWPYWRELIQSMCARMRMAQIVLPMYRVPKYTEQEKMPAQDIEKEKNV
jgi:uncharacterized protein YbgA (DUF1722 family)